MKICRSKMNPRHVESTKKQTGKRLSAFLLMIMTFLATQHWFHGRILSVLLGGSASQMMSMDHMQVFQRMMIVLTLITIMWSVYKFVKDGFKSKGLIVMTSISSLISVGYLVVILVKAGW